MFLFKRNNQAIFKNNLFRNKEQEHVLLYRDSSVGDS
jgi:hypothetical protein